MDPPTDRQRRSPLLMRWRGLLSRLHPSAEAPSTEARVRVRLISGANTLLVQDVDRGIPLPAPGETVTAPLPSSPDEEFTFRVQSRTFRLGQGRDPEVDLYLTAVIPRLRTP
jgi:hypothetical protein